jgi:cell shape-determining protein MreD
MNNKSNLRNLGGDQLDFPTIHTNFWDAVIAVPSVMIISQILKIFFKVQKKFVPLLALVLGFLISIFISHKGNLLAGIFMGYFYGYAAIGSYASLKTTLLTFRKDPKLNQ